MKQEIIQKIEQQIEAGIYPGASFAYYRDGEWSDCYLGEANPEIGEQTCQGLVYDLASVSKVVGVGTVLTFLWKQGKIELDQSIKTYLPEMDYPDITIRQLLTHSTDLDPFIINRDQLSAEELKEAMFHLNRREKRAFLYSDVHFLLLGFLLENYFEKDLDQILQEQVFDPWKMKETQFGPVSSAVPTVRGQKAGVVHDPKARLLGKHAGSAGLFSTVKDLKIFLEHYLQDDFADGLSQNFSDLSDKERSLAWNLEGDWLDHTGYTGTFIMWNRKKQEAAIFLSNRTYEKDERAQWILDRNQVMDLIREAD
ncbi:serine hydrolase domain-containing protein [Streptococcus infantis]|uniref:serine hydrolase domain-containing protein n=1 Tax=Streptococcus infantis TaxID=68892 RepID=UPI001CBEBFFE|nr:serine hydrolase domain-containing protein [Streptococcus infantis]MBZ2119682.1 beta-lactamase family protein [Streptococcus infantis]MBZ2121501.1 beta-lactamase family protein [Streptococcus infantis]MBZ2125406.1 beta-lactamase family protein [Streptococcus infantis]